eukprot:365706-Chlamydomonas_euryale.AAC.19
MAIGTYSNRASQACGSVRASQPCSSIRASQPCSSIRASQPCGSIRASQPCSSIRASQPCSSIRASQPCGSIRPPSGLLSRMAPQYYTTGCAPTTPTDKQHYAHARHGSCSHPATIANGQTALR